jgi:general secretion pathway protein G
MRGVNARRAALNCARAGFTLIELLLVMVILTVLAAIVVPKFVHRGEQARQTAAKMDISAMSTALDAFDADTGRYPTTNEGLNALVTEPSNVQNWNGPYLDATKMNDPWSHAFVYKCPGDHNTSGYDLYSYGPDGQEGGGDDIDNWTTN